MARLHALGFEALLIFPGLCLVVGLKLCDLRSERFGIAAVRFECGQLCLVILHALFELFALKRGGLVRLLPFRLVRPEQLQHLVGLAVIQSEGFQFLLVHRSTS